MVNSERVLTRNDLLAVFKIFIVEFKIYLYPVILSFTAFSIWPVQIFTLPFSNS